MQLAFCIVDNRCAIAIVVLPSAAWSNASCTTFSEAESRAEVASSKSKTLGLRMRALAIAMRSKEIRVVNKGGIASTRKNTNVFDRQKVATLYHLHRWRSHCRGTSMKHKTDGGGRDVLRETLNEVKDVCLPTSRFDLLLRDFRLWLDGSEQDVEAH
jgi:hypothetical protein